MAKFQVYFSKAKDYRWRLKSANGEIVAVSEGYVAKQSAVRSVSKVKELTSVATYEDLTIR